MSDTPPPPPPPPSAPPPPPPIGNSGRRPAGGHELVEPRVRVLARFLDEVILLLVFGSIIAAIILTGDEDAGLAGLGGDLSVANAYAIGLLGAVIDFLWHGVCTKQFGGSPMKLAFGMKVVQENGADVEWEHAIKRWALPGALALLPPIARLDIVITFVPFVIVIVSLVFIFSKPLRTAVWDLFAKTLVVKSR